LLAERFGIFSIAKDYLTLNGQEIFVVDIDKCKGQGDGTATKRSITPRVCHLRYHH
jgi:hypothetical protein